MTSRRKDTRQSRFNLWVPAKVVVSEKPDSSPAESGTSENPTSDSIIPESGRSRLRLRLTRSGSKILVLLGLRGSSKGNKQSTVDTECSKSVQTGDENIHPPSPSSGGNNGDGSPGYLTAVDSPQSEPLPATPSFNTPIESAETSSEPLPDLRQSPESRGEPAVDEFPQQNPASEDRPLPVAQQPSLTNSKFVDRFSHKISLAFGQSTVIHHAHRCSRPSILRVNSPVLEELSKQGDCANDSSGPSTTPSSVSSPIGGQSSPLTPLTTGLTFSSSDKSKLCDEDGQKSAGAYWPSLSNIENTTDAFSDAAEPEVLPSIKTVEATSVAKVYLELYFNSIFQNKDLRQQRQLELEQHIYSFELTAEECSMTRHNWILRENDYLRKCRALKSNRCNMQSEETISIAGYKAVKVLGKGSFGVVRLVRKSDLKDINDENPLAVNENSFHARSNPLGVLKSAVEGAKQSRRRYMTGKRKEVYAMKVIKKAEMIRNCQEGHIRAERDFLVASERSRWVVPLIASFQDTNHLYLVMDYMVGGDFLGLLIRRDTLREDWARFYVAEMILCIEEAHRLLWIHRDVKPDNFLISASGHLKISDFGLAFNGHWSHDQAYYNSHRYSLIEKLGIDVKGDAEDQKEDAEEKELAPEVKLHSTDDHILQQPPSTGLLNWRDNKGRRRFAKSVVGTSQYMAPEVIRGEMYDGRCDWWSLGIILYECLYGFTPFACENRHDTKIKILQHNRTLQFPRERLSEKMISMDAIDLITRILQEREYRLCSPKYQSNDILNGRPVSTQMLYSMDARYRNIASYCVYANDATDIKIHPFFRGIRWQELHLCQPPFVPRVKNWEDTRYFDDWKLLGNVAELPAASNSEEITHCPDQDLEDIVPDAQQPRLPEEPVVEPQTAGDNADAAPEYSNATDKKKEKKRPRDKILRDKQMSKTVMDIRKKGAFLGYTYRRPNEIALAFSTERGRQRHARGQLSGLYGS